MNLKKHKDSNHECTGISDCLNEVTRYGSETWALGAADRRKINAFEMWCWRRMLGISWNEHKSNEFVNNQIGNSYIPED